MTKLISLMSIAEVKTKSSFVLIKWELFVESLMISVTSLKS